VERVYDRDEGDERLRNRATVSIELDSSEKSIEQKESLTEVSNRRKVNRSEQKKDIQR